MATESLLEDAWSSESYAEEAPNYLSMAGRLVERVGVDADERVLDVACGTGNVAITAARRGAQVTGVDLTPGMLRRARENAAVAGLEGIEWREADATDLPFEADAFDATLSALGHMYGDPPAATTRELLAVTRPGGRLGFTAWTPTSTYAELAGVVASFLPPAELPEFSEPPFLWGDRDVVRKRLDDGVEEFAFETATLTYPAQSPAHFWRGIATRPGVFSEALTAVDDDDRAALEERAVEAIARQFDDARNAVVLEYLLTEATVR